MELVVVTLICGLAIFVLLEFVVPSASTMPHPAESAVWLVGAGPGLYLLIRGLFWRSAPRAETPG